MHDFVLHSAKGDDADDKVQESVLDEKAAGDEAGPSDEKEVDEDEVDEGGSLFRSRLLPCSGLGSLHASPHFRISCLRKQLLTRWSRRARCS